MKIDISTALNRPGTAVSFECSKDMHEIIISGNMLEFISPLVITGKLMYTGKDFNVNGTIEVEYKTQCNRCTKDVINNLKFDFSEEFSKTLDDDHPDRYLFANNEIDLESMALDNISLMVPMKHLCDEDCKGLCPVCGSDLNDIDCSCAEEQLLKSSPFAKLGKLSFEDENREV
jgi:uncharacterized protein